MALSNYGVKKISEYFHAGPYYIPDYQRDYSWEAKVEVNELWEDILTVINENISEFFLGQVVVHDDGEDGKKYIIDGQQRTITFSILLLVLRNWLDTFSNNTTDPAGKTIQKINGMMGIIDKDDKEEKIVLAEKDKDYFINNMLYDAHDNIISANPQRKARKNFIGAYKHFYSQVEKYISEYSMDDEKVEKLKVLFEVITNNLKMLYIETTSESEAFLIFETLNARGRDLETSDLLKNYLYRISGATNLDEMKSKWDILTDALGSYNITNYIRCIWNAQKEFTREKLLYKKITNEYKSPKQAMDFIKTLLDCKDVYLSMLDPENRHCFVDNSEHKKLENTFLDLADLKIRTYYPIIIAYYITHKSDEDLIQALTNITRGIEKVIVRDIVIMKRSPASYEPSFATIAQRISDMYMTKSDEIIKELEKISVSDTELESGFEQYQEKDTAQGKAKIRYILRKIINSQSITMKINRDNSEVHIEHIMPITKGEWKIDDKDHEEYLWKIGNLTLLDYDINENIKNSLFDVKAPKYAESNIVMNKDLSKLEKWDIEEINNRQKHLFTYVKKIWGFN